MDKLFDRSRLPGGLKLLPLLIYLPVGVLLGYLRFFIGLQTLIVAAILQKVDAVRAVFLRALCLTLGLVVKEENAEKRKENVSLIVSNHVSILDHVALNLATGSMGINFNAPFVVQHTFRTKSLEKDVVLPGEVLDLQPEEAITNGRHGLLRFRTVPSNIAREVQPVALRFWRPPLVEVSSNTLGATWFADLFWFLFTPFTVITIKYLPVIKRDDCESDEEWTRRMESAIAEDLGLEATGFTAAAKADLEKQLLPLDEQLHVLGPAHVAVRLKEAFPSLSLEVIRDEIERTKVVRVAVQNLMRLNELKNQKDDRKSEWDTAASSFPKSAQDRMMSFQERKTRLIETARKRYIEKRALNVASS